MNKEEILAKSKKENILGDEYEIETGQFNPTAKLALILCIALDKKFEELFYFDE